VNVKGHEAQRLGRAQGAAGPGYLINTVGTPGKMGLMGGNGTTAAGSLTLSLVRQAGIPPISTVTEPGGMVTPGPWGVPGPAGGGAFTMGQVCVSPTRQAGFPPISTVGHPGPIMGGPCTVDAVTVVAGNDMAVREGVERSRTCYVAKRLCSTALPNLCHGPLDRQDALGISVYHGALRLAF